MYVFYEEITPIVYKDRLFVQIPENAARLPLSQMVNIASSVMPGDVKLSRIIVPGSAERTVIFAFEKHDEHAWTYSSYVEFYKTIFVNPYTGDIEKIENTKWEFFNVVYWVHISLLLGYEIGSPIVTWSVYILVFLLFSGLILWWPTKKKRGYFWFRWKTNTKWKRKNYDLHRIPGFYITPIALVFALTGLFWASPGFNTLTRWLANGGQQVTEKELPPPEGNAVLTKHPLDLVYHKTDSMAPGARYIMIRPPFRPNFPYAARAYKTDVNYERMEFYFDQFSIKLVEAVTFETRNNGDKLSVLNYDLHVGTIGGISTKILAFLGSLIVASSPITGFYIWWQRNKKKRETDSNESDQGE